MSVLHNCRVLWTSIQSPDVKYEHVWRTDVIVTQEQADALLKEAKALDPKGIKFRKGDNGEIIFRVKRKVTRADGSENKAPVCKSTVKDELTGELLLVKDLVGNGSLCNLQYNLYRWENSFGTGVNADFCGLQIIDLVSYGVADGDEFEEMDSTTKTTKPLENSEEYDDDL